MSFQRVDRPDCTVSILNEGTDEQLLCIGYRPSFIKNAIFYFLTFITVGFPFLLSYWKPDWGVRLRQRRCCLSIAETVLLKDKLGNCQPAVIVSQHVTRSFPREFVYSPTAVANSNSGCDINCIVNARSSLTDNEGLIFRHFYHRKAKYFWHQSDLNFRKLRGYDWDTPCSSFLERFPGLTIEQRAERGQLFGENVINVEVKSYTQLFFEEVLNPFYIFQIFSIILWCLDDYYYFAACIFVISAMSMAISLYEIKKQSKILHDLATGTSSTVTVIRRDGAPIEIQSHLLVPGDLLVIPTRGCTMTCDAVVTAGNCIVNESMLTGESVPVVKTPITYQDENEIFNPEQHKRHTLFCGTQVIQTRYYGNTNVTAVVIRTGFSTAKGELIRSILFPRPVGFKFYQDSMKFIIILFFIALLGMIYSMTVYIKAKMTASRIIIRMLDVVTVVVPPALPAAMTVGSVYAQNRLKKKNIFCISPPTINICGKLKLICFDKTGTLTEEGLDLWGIVLKEEGSDNLEHIIRDPSTLPPTSPLLVAMATCHSLTTIEGELAGDPLDLKMFEATKWVMEEPGQDSTRYDLLCPNVVHPDLSNTSISSSHSDVEAIIEGGQDSSRFDMLVPTVVKPITKETYVEPGLNVDSFIVAETPLQIPYEVGIVRQFPFSSSLQRMSVITRTLGVNHMDLFVKGAPEKIVSLCESNSVTLLKKVDTPQKLVEFTVPENFHDKLNNYTIQGYRVIALAWRSLDSKITWHHAQRIKRDEVEKDLSFLGLIIMQNMLKFETTPIIRQLKKANIRTVMITGDNLHTAISVARECSMIETHDKVIVIDASPPSATKPAILKMEYADRTTIPSEVASLNESVNGDTTSIDQLILNVENIKLKYHFCMSGKSFAVLCSYFPEFIDRIITSGTVFARMAPDQKAQLVEKLQEIDYVVGMCGDGANDCSALKTAHVGISLSEAEASVAAPFTSKNDNIQCVTELIKEGRCALVTSFGVFKYMALYSMIQFVSVLILYTFKTNLGDFQFLYIDLGLATVMAVVMGYTEAYPELAPRSPPGSLVKLSNIISIMLQILTVSAVQIGSIILLRSYSWYSPVVPDADSKFKKCWEVTIIFSVSAFQYIILALAFSRGPPFRKPVYTNIPMIICLIFFSIINCIILIYPFHWFTDFFQINDFHFSDHLYFRAFLGTLIISNVIISLLIEVFVNSKLLKKLCCTKKQKKKYKLIEQDIQSSNHWPIVGEVYYSSVIT